MVEKPDALLRVIDDSPSVGAAERKREIDHLQSRYLSLRAQARAAAARAEGLSARRAELSDVRHKLDFLQRGGRARQLGEYRRRRKQDDTWQAVVTAARESVAAVEARAGELLVAELDLDASQDDDPALADLAKAHEALSRVMRELRQAVLDGVEDAQRAIGQVLAGERSQGWRRAVEASEERFREAASQLAELGIRDPGQYHDLVADSARLRREIDGLERERDRASELEGEAARALEQYRQRRADLGDARSAVAAAATRDDIRVDVAPFKNHRRLADALTEVLATERFEADRSAIGDAIRPASGESWSWAGLDGLVADVRRFQAGDSAQWPSRDWRFEGALKKVPPERVDRLALYAPGDTVRIEFRDRQRGWRRLSRGSPGQQTAALLAFVLGRGSEPIILDQPEDDLDNTLIYDLLVSRLKETKLRRQVIVVTHNPNIVVHGDAEFVLSLDAGNGESRKACEGGLQERKVRAEICRVMEGGREAFRSRYRRIMPHERAAP